MAITAANASYITGAGPTVDDEVRAGCHEQDFLWVGSATITGVWDVEDEVPDTDVDFEVNWIDGTKDARVAPTKVWAMRIGGDAAAAIKVVSCTLPTSKKFLCTLSDTPVVDTTVEIMFFAAR